MSLSRVPCPNCEGNASGKTYVCTCVSQGYVLTETCKHSALFRINDSTYSCIDCKQILTIGQLHGQGIVRS